MRRIAALTLILAAPAVAAPSPEAEAVVDGFHSALAKGDTGAAAALLADDALIFEEGGAERSKTEYAAHHLQADAVFSGAVASTIVRRSSDEADGLAWVASEGRVNGSYKGKAVDRLTTETMVLRRTADGWRIVHVHWSSAARN
jgi:ketosteroid isomerase-like protein